VFGFDDDARPALRAAAAAGRAAALATIVALDGGGPRPVGTQMVITDMTVSGFLSGGCLEADVVGHARAVLDDGEPRRLVYGQGSPWPDIRLLCGARIDVQLERILPTDASIRALLALADGRSPATWQSDGRHRECAVPGQALAPWPGAFERLYLPSVRLIVIGSDPTALAIAMLGVQIGCETILVRPKGPVEPPPIAGALYSREDPDEALAHFDPDPWTAIAVATHDADLDHAALALALPSQAFYVGALGARRRVPERVEDLRRSGLSEAAIGRLRAPIGLNIGGKAPWEVAVAVLAEITAARYDIAL
jgi:xanthine dehydrogenase accessory factor